LRLNRQQCGFPVELPPVGVESVIFEQIQQLKTRSASPLGPG
jgi:hypothetical protein